MIIKSLKKLCNIRFFKTRKEKIYILRALRTKNVWPLFVYLCYISHLGKFFRIKRSYYTIYLQRSPYSFWLYFHQKAERKEEEFVHAFVQPGDTVVDCGSHLATVLLTAIHACKASGWFYAFEAHPDTYALTRQNIAPYKGLVSVHNKAIGDREGLVRINSSYVSDMNHIADHKKDFYEVELTTLEKELSETNTIALIKLDIEGYELFAMKGLGHKIKDVEAILFESSSGSFGRYGYTLSDCLLYLDSKGFTVYTIVDAKKLVLEKITKTYETSVRYEDLIALSSRGKIRLQKRGGRVLPE